MMHLNQVCDTKVHIISSPADSLTAQKLEIFLVKIFEYGNYSFRKAIAGQLSKDLQCVFFIAQKGNDIIAAAGSLFSPANPSVALFGPVCVAPQYRRLGLAHSLCQYLLAYLESNDVQAVYLGVDQDNPATRLYEQLGFEHLSGIVMRRLLVSRGDFQNRYTCSQKTIITNMQWDNYPEISALCSESAEMQTFDLSQHIFSSKYVPVSKFLSVFPAMINRQGSGQCLQTEVDKSIVGIAHIHTLPYPQKHIALLDFFILDTFISDAEYLLRTTIKECVQHRSTIMCSCPKSDLPKISILKTLGAKACVTLPQYILRDSKFDDIVVFKL